MSWDLRWHIYKMHIRGESTNDLANRFELSEETIVEIINGFIIKRFADKPNEVFEPEHNLPGEKLSNNYKPIPGIITVGNFKLNPNQNI